MRKFITLIILILFSNYLFAKYPKVFVSINPKTVVAGDKLEVTVGAVAKKGSKFIFPKIDTIGGNKVISNKAEVSHHIAKINGKKTSLTKRAITYIIKPNNNFDMDIFKIKIDKKRYKTSPFKVNVKKKNTQNIATPNNTAQEDNLNSENALIFKMSSTKQEVVLGESFIVKVELFEPMELSSSELEYTPPKFIGFDAKPLGDGKVLEQANSVIRVIEYLVTPKKAGVFTIKPAIAKIGIDLAPQAQSPFGFFGTNTQWKTISTKPLKIVVKKLPQNVDLVGIFRIKAITDTKYAKANKPFNYTLQIDGIGNLEDLSEPKFNIKGITSYSDDAKIEHLLKRDKIYSKFTKKYVFISDKDFTIPSTTLTIYSPSANKVYKIKTEPYLVKVKKSKSILDALSGIKSDVQKVIKNPKALIKEQEVPTKDVLESNDKELSKVEDLLFDKYYYKRRYSIDGYPFSALFGAFILGIIIGVGAVLLNRFMLKVFKKATGKDRAYNSYEEALSILYPHVTKSKHIENMVENLYEVVNGNSDLKIDDYALNKMVKRVLKGKS